MKLPSRYEGPLGYESDIDYFAMELTISDWRGGRDPGKPLCIFNRLVNGDDVPADKVAKHARAVAETIHETSRFIAEKPKLLAVAEYAERVAPHEKFAKRVAALGALGFASGMRYSDAERMLSSAWSAAEEKAVGNVR